MRGRLIVSLILGILVLPIAVVGLIDPLEGGLALIVAVLVGALIRVLSRVPVPRLAWMAMAATLAVGLVALILAVAGMPGEESQVAGPEASAPNPLSVTVRVLVWVYRVGVLVVLVGAIAYLVRIGQALRSERRSTGEELAT